MCTVKSDTSGCNIATINPFRYRGYYYDEEIGLYYLQSRYYDASVGRFVNADEAEFASVEGSTLYSNLFCYCENDCVNLNDDVGYLSINKFLGVIKNAILSLTSFVWKVLTKIWNYLIETYIPIKFDRKKIFINAWVISTVIDKIIELISKVTAIGIKGFVKAVKLFAKASKKRFTDLLKNKIVPFFAKTLKNPIQSFLRTFIKWFKKDNYQVAKEITNDYISFVVDTKSPLLGSITNYVLSSVNSFGTFVACLFDVFDSNIDGYYCIKLK